jgi:phage terminase large subunit-like protein
MEPTSQPDIVTWAEGSQDSPGRFWVPELGHTVELGLYQRRVLAEIFRPADDGSLRYSTIVWSDVKKSIKSTIGAAVCLWWADTHPWASVRIIANDLKQADSREGEYIRRAIELNPKYFTEQRRAHIKPSGCSVELGNHSTIEAVPLDPTGEAGGGDDVVLFTELWGARNDAAKRMWTEVTLSPLKFGKSFRWVETYAGFTGASPILEQLYEQGVKKGRRISDDLEMYVNDAARLFVFWNTQPGLLPWLTPEYYAQEAATLTESEFTRVHRNQWVRPEEAAIPPEWWAACLDRHPLRVDPSGKGEPTPLVIGVDASVSGDCTALSVVSRHPTLPGHICERHTRVWTPPPGGKMDYDATLTPEVERLVRTFNVVAIDYDPYQLHLWATQLSARLNVWCREFPQGTDRLIADKGLYDLIRDRKLHQSGNETLAAHVGNANAKTEGDGDSKFRFVKRTPQGHIDGCVALSMAAAECLRLNL